MNAGAGIKDQDKNNLTKQLAGFFGSVRPLLSSSLQVLTTR
jgi:hypothetical protein